jgi:uncharacterized protein YndB with AHSA1/START domain
MEEPTVLHSTFVVERSYPSTPERVFAAFADPAQKRRWYADRKTTEIETFEMDFRVGGVDRLRTRMGDATPFPGAELANDITYQDIVTNRRIIMAYSMSLAGKRISASLGTIELLQTKFGTDLIFTEQGAFFENSGGPEMRKQGWETLLDSLGKELSA